MNEIAPCVVRSARRFRRALAPSCRAVPVTGALFHTQGGLGIDAQCRVLGPSGVPDSAAWGFLSGNGPLSTLAGGAIAARTAADPPAAKDAA